MISLSSIIGLVGCILLPVGFSLTVLRTRQYPAAVRGILFLFACGLVLIPVNNLVVAGYIRGVIGDVSVTTLILVVAACISQVFNKDVYKPLSASALLLLVLAGGMVLYPSALGLSFFDAYELGYGSPAFILLLFLLTLAAWYFNVYLVVLCSVLSIAAYLSGIYESRNLWDYLIDPLIVSYALFQFLGRAARQIFHRVPGYRKRRIPAPKPD